MMMNILFATILFFVTLSTVISSEVGVRVLLNEGRRTGLGNPCNAMERELIKSAFRQAASGENYVKRTSRQLMSCSYLCEDYDRDVCYLAHPSCAGWRREDEVDHHDDENYPDKVGIEKFENDHVLFENICDMSVSSIEEISKCNTERAAIKNIIHDFLESHVSDTCVRLIRTKLDLTCFRL